ncbi:hypothetical protein SISNIDRAFT_486774 [Sistotremastrum niveocremeum HHB9708]|uniref:Uncharacterized protein n=1 Tax=Sistotremastrum niveocremeum HHB9708 TaxID=1314777 RepID=A0A164TBT6_9AGAM|nr:hypothetical protein SISNIDRAFT_486774 [Sistotremastrum niveocremeum HHB9708]
MTTHIHNVTALVALLQSSNITFSPPSQWVQNGGLICSSSQGSAASANFTGLVPNDGFMFSNVDLTYGQAPGMAGFNATVSVIGSVQLPPSDDFTLASAITLDNTTFCTISSPMSNSSLNTTKPPLCAVTLPQDGEQHTISLSNTFSGASVCLDHFAIEIFGISNSVSPADPPTNFTANTTIGVEPNTSLSSTSVVQTSSSPASLVTTSFLSPPLSTVTSVTSSTIYPPSLSTSSVSNSLEASAGPTTIVMAGNGNTPEGSTLTTNMKVALAASIVGPLCLLIVISALLLKCRKSRSRSLSLRSENSFQKIDPYRTHFSLILPSIQAIRVTQHRTKSRVRLASKPSVMARHMSFSPRSKCSSLATHCTTAAATIASRSTNDSSTSSSATLVETQRHLRRAIYEYLHPKWQLTSPGTRAVGDNERTSTVGAVENMVSSETYLLPRAKPE